MGLHQDKDESARVARSRGCRSSRCRSATRRGSCSAGRGAAIRWTPILLESGDAFVFGGPARLRYHGVSRIVPGTAPPELGMTGRFNLTFRQYLTATLNRAALRVTRFL